MLVRSSFTRGNISASMRCPAAPVSMVALFTHFSFTSTTFLGDAPALFSTPTNDSWANFFVFNFDFLLVTSCHCSFSLSSNKHHSCASSLMSPLSSSTTFRLLFQLPLVQFAAMCHVFPQLQRTGVTLTTFLLPFPPFLPPVLDHCPFPPRFAPFSPFPLMKYFLTLQLGTLVQMLFRTLLRTLRRHRFLRPCRSPLVRSCQFSSPWTSNSCDNVLQRDEQFFVWQHGAPESIIQQTLGHQLFSLPKSSPRLGFSKTFLHACSSR